tara:strand:- start:272 stop:3046 length:2775 start_codon:yes stop_codon:yes gene_type:complete
MSRIKTADKAGVIYQGSSSGGSFNPVKAQNNEKALKEWKAAINADAQTIGRELSRKQQSENTALSLSQGVERSQQKIGQFVESAALKQEQLQSKNQLGLSQAFEKSQLKLGGAELQAQQGVASANFKAVTGAVEGLLNLSSSYLKYKSSQIELDYKNKVENQQLESLGLGTTFGNTDNKISVDEKADLENIDTSLKVESKVLNDEANKIAGSDDPIEINTESMLRQGTTWNQLSEVRGNVFSARSMLPQAFQEAIDSGLIQAGPEGYIQAQQFIRSYAKATGLLDADERLVKEHFLPTAQNLVETKLVKINTEHADALRKSNQVVIESNVSNVIDGSTIENIGSNFDEVVKQVVLGNGTGEYGGKNSKAATIEALELTLDNLILNGDVDKAEELKKHVYNKATGITLGKEFDSIFDTKIDAARTKSNQLFDQKTKTSQNKIKSLKGQWIQNPSKETEAAYIKGLEACDRKECKDALSNILEKPEGSNPNTYNELLKSKRKGDRLDEDHLLQLKTDNIISDEQFQTLSKKTGVVAVALAKVDDALSDINLKDSLMQANEGIPKNQTILAKIEARMPLLKRRLEDLVAAEVSADPTIANDDVRLARTIENKLLMLQKSPEFKISIDPDLGYTFESDLALTNNQLKLQTQIRTQDGNEDYTNVLMKDVTKDATHEATIAGQDFTKVGKQNFNRLFNGNSYPISEMNPSQDKFLTMGQLNKELNNIATGKDVTPRTKAIARKLNLSGRGLISAQLTSYDKPDMYQLLQTRKKELATKGGYVEPSEDIVGINNGYKAIVDRGVPEKGAAYLAGNIQQESSWQGDREWGSVQGDGTSRNGGLVSWAQWHDDPARLGAIERKYGRRISAISEHEQLDYMLYEMKNYYPQAYAIFMNPNSSEADLRWASYRYWGYGEAGRRFQYAKDLLSKV